jgi:polysaccharide chain length determinant protein (PEP-CTERM system associated)
MLPSTRLTIDDVLLILRRRAGLVLVTVALVAAATAAGALLLPNRYRSETLILVLPQRVPETYVKSTVTARIEDRLHSITQEILSRTRLERIIRDFGLYAVERRTRLMETIVEDMRRDIDIKVVKGDAFRVAYVGDDARTVMQVTNGLAALFIEENLRDREELADGTNRFLDAQLADARERLIAHEQQLERYRSRFSGELPSQLAPNLQVIQNVQLQIQSLTDSTNRDADRRTLVERQLRETERELESDAAATAPSGADPIDAAGSGPAPQLVAARTELDAMERRLGPAHPDLQRMRNAVRELEATVASEARPEKNGDARPVAPNAQTTVRRARAADLRIELEQLERQIASKHAEEQRLRGIGQRYEQRIERVPARESELAELTRDYSTLQTLYQTLLAKQQESKIAANLERRQIGAQFKLLDPARVAEKPFRPRRWLIDLCGAAAGLALALTFVGVLEHRDRTFNTDDEVKNELMLPVLAVVPLMESDEEQKRRARRRFLVTGAIATVVGLCVPIVIYSCLL